jgi:GNAT superfamily N-acetyltransferase
MEIRIAECFDVMVQLRPKVTRGEWVPWIRALETDGSQLAYLTDAGTVRAVAGIRIGNMLARGRHMYIDDLVTGKTWQSKGYGGRLFEWLLDRARTADCQQVDLDSGVQRADAHRFGFHHGMHISSFHFRSTL